MFWLSGLLGIPFAVEIGMRINTFGLAFVAATLLGSSVQATVISINNPSFEQSTGAFDSGFRRYTSANQGLPGWTVTGSDVDHLQSPTYQADDGILALDLDGNTIGGIQQTISVPNTGVFRLVFALSGNPDGIPAEDAVPKTVRLTLSQGLLSFSQDFTFSTLSNSRSNMGWVDKSFSAPIVTPGNYELIFTSMTPGGYGPLVDNVSAQVPDGGLTVALLGLGMGAIGLVRRKLA